MIAGEEIQKEREAIAKKKEEMTVADKIVLHLGMFRKPFDEFGMSIMLTQDGIAYATGVKRAHVSVELKKLLRKNIVKTELAHVSENKRKRKTYLLTQKGYELSEKLDRALKDEGIDSCEILSYGEYRNEAAIEAYEILQITMNKLRVAKNQTSPDVKGIVSDLIRAGEILLRK